MKKLIEMRFIDNTMADESKGLEVNFTSNANFSILKTLESQLNKTTESFWIITARAFAIDWFLNGLLMGIYAGFHLTPPVTETKITMAHEFHMLGVVGFFIFGAILAPVIEELSFRKILPSLLHKKLGTVFPVLLSSFAWSIGHEIDFVRTALFTLMGINYAVAYKKSGTIWSPIIVHAINNSVTITTLVLLGAFK